MTEQEVIQDYIQRLSPHWHIHQEVEGNSIISGARKRIDMVIVSKEVPPKRVQPIAFGVEFKADQMESMNNYTGWLRQAIGYTQCEWGQRKARLPILVAPFIDRQYCGDIGKTHSDILSRLAGQFGIGELGLVEYPMDYGKGDWQMVIKVSDTRFWSSHDGWNLSMIGMNFSKRYEL